MVTMASGRRLTVKTAASLAKPAMWQRMRTGSATKGAKDYHWAMTEITPDDTPRGRTPGPAATSRTVTPGRYGDAATSTGPSKPTSDGMPTPTRRHGNDLQLP
jgi:hypothetical protein